MSHRISRTTSFVSSAALALALTASAGIVAPHAVQAQTNTVVVLGIRSMEGDDEFARNLTGAIRHSASQVAGWSLSDREVTLAQMALVHGCDQVTQTCMGEIAGSLEISRVVYGEVRRTSAGADYDFLFSLNLFNAETGEIEQSVAETLPGERTDIDDLRVPVRAMVSSLSGAPRVGQLTVSVNIPGAEVFIDETSVGTTDDNGQLVVSEVESGTRQVRVVAEGHASSRSTISVEPYGEATFEAELEPGTGDGGGGVPVELVVGGGLLAVAAASAGLWIWSMVEVDAVQQSDTFRSEREERPVGVDVCEANRPGGGSPTSGPLDEMCRRASTFEALQFVFLGVGAVAAGVGTYFLVAGLNGDEEDPESASIRLTPSFDQNGGYVGVEGQF